MIDQRLKCCFSYGQGLTFAHRNMVDKFFYRLLKTSFIFKKKLIHHEKRERNKAVWKENQGKKLNHIINKKEELHVLMKRDWRVFYFISSKLGKQEETGLFFFVKALWFS